MTDTFTKQPLAYSIFRLKAASKFELRQFEKPEGDRTVVKTYLFWTAAEPTGEKQSNKPTFCWDRTRFPGRQAVISLGESDIGQLLAVIDGYKSQAGAPVKNDPENCQIYHSNPKGSTTLTFRAVENNGFIKFQYSISQKLGEQVARVSSEMSMEEAQVLKILLQKYILTKYNW